MSKMKTSNLLIGGAVIAGGLFFFNRSKAKNVSAQGGKVGQDWPGQWKGWDPRGYRGDVSTGYVPVGMPSHVVQPGGWLGTGSRPIITPPAGYQPRDIDKDLMDAWI